MHVAGSLVHIKTCPERGDENQRRCCSKVYDRFEQVRVFVVRRNSAAKYRSSPSQGHQSNQSLSVHSSIPSAHPACLENNDVRFAHACDTFRNQKPPRICKLATNARKTHKKMTKMAGVCVRVFRLCMLSLYLPCV